MKKLQMLLAVLVMTITLSSCSNNDDNDNNGLSCDDAIAATIAAGNAFNVSTHENYSALCASYKVALEAQIESCGDSNGDLQALIDELGNCVLMVNPDETRPAAK